MPYDIAKMRAELNHHVAPLFGNRITGERINESFEFMRASDGRLGERLPSICLIPRPDANGDVVVDCTRTTVNSHAIQDKVLRRIASGNPSKVIDFMDIHTPRIARECQGPNGELWYKMPWNIERMPPQPVSPGSASTRHFACNPCDKRTFQEIEDAAIRWPTWPGMLVIDDLHSNKWQRLLSQQMFLLIYRCLLQYISQIRGLVAASEYAVTNDCRITGLYREILKARQLYSQGALEELQLLKSRYDWRLTGIADLPMIHYIVALEPAFPIASTAFTPMGYQHMATTVYPEPIERYSHPTEWQHWLVISAESSHRGELERPIGAIVEAAHRTIQNIQNSMEWTVHHVVSTGQMSTYGRPESYELFCQKHPDAARRIESDTPNMIVVEYYERYMGKALLHLC